MKSDQFNSEFYKNNLQEYNDPIQYDLENAWAADDDLYIDLVKVYGAPVLDIGCGTGRLTRAIAQLGFNIVGLDISQKMLDRAKFLAEELNITWILGDCRSFQSNQKFKVALMTSHVFQHLLTEKDQLDVFNNVHLHLEENGIFAFDTRGFEYRLNANKTSKSYARKLINQDNEEIMVDYKSTSFDKTNQLEHYKIDRINKTSNVSTTSEIYLKYTSQYDLNKRLNACGFEVINQYGDWQKNPYHSSSKELLTICRKQ